MRRIVLAVAALVLASCASSDRAVSHHERACTNGVRYVDLKRNRFGDGVVRPLPPVERDFFRHAIESVRGLRSRDALTTTVNDYLNERLDDLNSRRFNTIYVSIDAEHAVGITPAIHGEARDILMLWIDDSAMIFDGRGTLLAANPAQLGFSTLPPAKETFATSASVTPGREICSNAYASR